jgi:hypothetical protein
MFIFQRRVAPVLITLVCMLLFALLAGCAQRSIGAGIAPVRGCPPGYTEVYRANGPARNAERITCHSSSQLDSAFRYSP